VPYAPDIEVFDLLSQTLKAAAEKCGQLAWHPRRGFIYMSFIKDLREAEGCCRQISLRREDARWLPLGMQLAHIHKLSGKWLRSSPTKETRAAAHRLFKKTGETLRAIAYAAERLKFARTDHLGMILPAPITKGLPQRETSPVVVKLPNGLIVPPIIH
jgi:hypothetical protein